MGKLIKKNKWVSMFLVAFLLFTGCSTQKKATTTAETKPGTTAVTTAAASTKNTVTKATKSSASASTTATITSTKETKTEPESSKNSTLEAINVKEDGKYSTKMEVAAYLYKFNKLPSNFITKNKAMDLGWKASEGNLWKVTDKMSIGGDKFGNLEGLLPKKSGRQYYECDINYKGGNRGPERIVFSNDGLIFYTKDHYSNFEKLN